MSLKITDARKATIEVSPVDEDNELPLSVSFNLNMIDTVAFVYLSKEQVEMLVDSLETLKEGFV